MKRAAPKNPDLAPGASVRPSEDSTALAVEQAAALMTPIAVWLLRNGVSFTTFSKMMKTVFVDAARAELESSGIEATQSALSLLSGVHRKDVRDLSSTEFRTPAVARPTLSSQVYTRWLTDPRYRRGRGKPKALPRAGPSPSFETLCREISNDVHPRALLDELLRLGQVTMKDDTVVPMADSFIPEQDLAETTTLFVANAADHLSAAVSNLTTPAPRFLEQALYADGLRPPSIEALNKTARKVWGQALKTMATEARQLVEADRATDGDSRMRFGMYFYSAPAPGSALKKSPPKPSASKMARRSTGGKRS